MVLVQAADQIGPIIECDLGSMADGCIDVLVIAVRILPFDGIFLTGIVAVLLA